MEKFPCSGCGACCKRIGLVLNQFREMYNFPYNAKEDGSCEMLDENNMCKVYDNRPEICSLDRMYERNHKQLKTKKEFYLETAKICNTWMEEDKLEEKYKIDINSI